MEQNHRQPPYASILPPSGAVTHRHRKFLNWDKRKIESEEKKIVFHVKKKYANDNAYKGETKAEVGLKENYWEWIASIQLVDNQVRINYQTNEEEVMK